VLVKGEGELSRRAKVALDSLTFLQPAGQTSFGQLWSFTERNSVPSDVILIYPLREIQLGLLLAFGLLAIPTPGSITGRRMVSRTK
jgi:hypothetical protein